MAAVTFCGASVTGFNSRLGLGQGKGSLDMTVIEDERNGDFFNPPPLGTPAYFTFGAYKFWGLLRSWERQNSRSGLGIYNLQIEDPREILAATQVITDGYHGSTFGVPNILNVYGFWEDVLGYGGADVNGGGMKWSLVSQAIQLLTNEVAGSMGGPLLYRGIAYAVDLSNLPVPPADYRVSGSPLCLLDLIETICNDGGCDFFVELDRGNIIPIIRIYTLSRYLQPPLGTLAALVNSNWGGTLVKGNNGIELNSSSSTSTFYIGGPVESIVTTTNISPFWGYDTNTGEPIPNMIVNIGGLGYCNAAFIDCAEVSGFFNTGQKYYFLSEFEMQALLGGDTNTWMLYLNWEATALGNAATKRNAIGPAGIMCAFQDPIPPKLVALSDMLTGINTSAGGGEAALLATDVVHDFLLRIAQEWYGKKYWAYLPFITQFTDPETLIISHSNEISDAGWISGGGPLDLGGLLSLGILPENELKFQKDDGRYEPVAVYSPVGIALENASADDSALQSNAFYTKISVDDAIFTSPANPVPSVLVTVNNPPQAQLININGNNDFLDLICNQVNGVNAGNAWKLFQGKRAFGTFNIQIAPPFLPPQQFAIALKSNVTTYGPWWLVGAEGKVSVVQDTSLTPWEYGSDDAMNLAGNAKVLASTTFMQIAENGSLEFTGAPLTTLGRTLLANGPETTNIEVHIGPEGVTTNYQFRTFTENHLTRFTKGQDERIKRLGRTQNELRKTMLLTLDEQVDQADTVARSKATRQKRYPKEAVAWSSPSPVLIAHGINNNGTSVKTSVAVTDTMEGWGGIGAIEGNDELFCNSAMVSLSALLRPFDCTPSGRSLYLPKPISNIVSINGITFNSLNPYQPNLTDVEFIANGPHASGSNYAVSQGVDWNNVRSIAINSPIMVAGYGYDIHGNVTPTGTFYPQNFNVGPVDLLWDMNRGVWTSHGTMFGLLNSGPAGAHSTAVLDIYDASNNTSKKINVVNNYSSTVPSGSACYASWLPYTSVWAITSADCPAS